MRLCFVVDIFVSAALNAFEQFKMVMKAGAAENIPSVPELPFFAWFRTDCTDHRNLLTASICRLISSTVLGSFEKDVDISLLFFFGTCL